MAVERGPLPPRSRTRGRDRFFWADLNSFVRSYMEANNGRRPDRDILQKEYAAHAHAWFTSKGKPIPSLEDVLKQAKGVRLLEEQRAYMRQYREDKRNDSKETAAKKKRASPGDSTSDDDSLTGHLVDTEADTEAARFLQGFGGLAQHLGGFSSQWQPNPAASLIRGSKKPRGTGGAQCLMMLAEKVRSGEAGPEPCGRQQLQSPFAQLQPQTRLPPAFTTALSLAGQPAPAVTGTDLGGWRLLSAYLQQQQQAHTLADLAKVQALLSQHQQQQQALGMGLQHSLSLSLLEQLQQQQQRQHSILSNSMHSSFLPAVPSASVGLMHPPSCALSTCPLPLPAQPVPGSISPCGGHPAPDNARHPAASAATAPHTAAPQGTHSAEGLSAQTATAGAATPAEDAEQNDGQLCQANHASGPTPPPNKVQAPSPKGSLAHAGSCDASEATRLELMQPKSGEMEANSDRLAAVPSQALQQAQQQQQQHLQLVYGHGNVSAGLNCSLPLHHLQQQQQQPGVYAPLAYGLLPPPAAAPPPVPAAAALQVVQHGGMLYLLSAAAAEPVLQQQQQATAPFTLQPLTVNAAAHAHAPLLHPATAPIALPASAAAAAAPLLGGPAHTCTMLPQPLPPLSGGLPLSVDASLLSLLPCHGAQLPQGPSPAGHLLYPLTQLQPQL